jgi:hypothetical protein
MVFSGVRSTYSPKVRGTGWYVMPILRLYANSGSWLYWLLLSSGDWFSLHWHEFIVVLVGCAPVLWKWRQQLPWNASDHLQDYILKCLHSTIRWSNLLSLLPLAFPVHCTRLFYRFIGHYLTSSAKRARLNYVVRQAVNLVIQSRSERTSSGSDRLTLTT